MVERDDCEPNIRHEELDVHDQLVVLEREMFDDMVGRDEIDIQGVRDVLDEVRIDVMVETVEDDEAIRILMRVDEVVDDDDELEDFETVEKGGTVEYEMIEHTHIELVEMVEILDCLERVELVVHDDLIEIMVREMVETDIIDELVDYDELVEMPEMVESELSNDERGENRLEDIQRGIDEMQSQMFIDSTWMQEIFTTIVSMRVDETADKGERLNAELHETVEMGQTVDKWLFHMRICVSNDVLMWVQVAGVNHEILDVRNVERVEFKGIHETIDDLFWKLQEVHLSKISRLKMTQKMNQFWFRGKIQELFHGIKQWFVIQQRIIQQI